MTSSTGVESALALVCCVLVLNLKDDKPNQPEYRLVLACVEADIRLPVSETCRESLQAMLAVSASVPPVMCLCCFLVREGPADSCAEMWEGSAGPLNLHCYVMQHSSPLSV